MAAQCLRYDVPENCSRKLNAAGDKLWSGEPCPHCDRPVREQPPSALLAPAKREATKRLVAAHREEYDRLVAEIAGSNSSG